MQIRKELILSGLAALLLSAMQPAAHGQSLPCWIKKVEERNGKLYIHFLPNYRQWAFVTKRSQERQDEASSSDKADYLVMREGERASVSDRLHSGCTMSVGRSERQLGLQTESYVSLPGLPADKRTYFIPAELGNESQQQKSSE